MRLDFSFILLYNLFQPNVPLSTFHHVKCYFSACACMHSMVLKWLPLVIVVSQNTFMLFEIVYRISLEMLK